MNNTISKEDVGQGLDILYKYKPFSGDIKKFKKAKDLPSNEIPSVIKEETVEEEKKKLITPIK